MFTNHPTSKISRWQSVIFFLLAVGLFIYAAYRATFLSMTCDEASTYFSHVPHSVFPCFFSESCWSDANNHLLNTFLMQGSIGIFGVAEWTLRLPNLLGHLMYLIFSMLLVRRVSSNFWVAVAGFCLLNMNPFFIDFFSLARGYGLGSGWMMMSFYFLYRWVVVQKMKWAILSFAGAFMAVMSNFVFLNYWASLSAVFVFFILENRDWQFSKLVTRDVWSKFFLPIFSAVVLFILLKNPIHFLSSKNEFVYGTESLLGSFNDLVKLSLIRQGYFNPFTKNVFALLSLILLGFSTVFGVFNFLKNRRQSFPKIQFAAILLMILFLVGLVIQYHLLDIKYLDRRKATILVPIFGMAIFVFLEFLYLKSLNKSKGINKKLAVSFAILMTSFSFVHFQRTFDLHETVEWKYDAETKNMVEYLREILPKKQDTHVAVYYFFEPATHFYQEQFGLGNKVQLTRIHDNEIEQLAKPDFIYLQKKDGERVPQNYILEKEFGDEGILFRKFSSAN